MKQVARKPGGGVRSLAPLMAMAAFGSVLSGASSMAQTLEPAARAPTAQAENGCAMPDPRARLDCLEARRATSEWRLESIIRDVKTAIEARDDLHPPQKRRWIGLFEESQSRFLHWRTFECQSVAPYEGGGAQNTVGGRLGGIGMLEQRLICLTAHNDARSGDLRQRYDLPEPSIPENMPTPQPSAPKEEAGQPSPPGASIPAPATSLRIIEFGPP